MEHYFNIENLKHLSIGFLTLLVFVYLLPFAISPLIRVIMTLWGFHVGRRRKKGIQSSNLIIVNIPKDTSNLSQPQNNDAQRIIDIEFEYLHTLYVVKKDRYINELEKINNKIILIKESQAINKQHQQNNESAIGGIFKSVKTEFNQELFSNVLLSVVIGVILFVDTLIASEIFESLNLASGEISIIKDVTIKLTIIYGLFMTITVSFLLYWMWPRRKLLTFVNNKKSSIVIGLVVIFLFFISRLAMVAIPDSAKDIVEIITLMCWTIGVIAVYWLVGEVVGEPPQWFKLMIAILVPVIFVLLLLFGVFKILEIVAGAVISTTLESWFQLSKARKSQQEENVENSYLASKQGFFRGFTT
ncbi:MAG: hypothetical protein IPO85_18780 [Saprospiraceae bacterium]|uniref:Uncharacterized protein n=1 Tax=Candidatus Defluviibacterium haderslevense TaxID=2981993 RepID=A0A9D7SCP1_9BACT|nr:hypothetical protein [Candidatus Defluviibacterium haderslevense]